MSFLEVLQYIFLALVLCLMPGGVLAHFGGLNSEGCHNNRKTGDYHCHKKLDSVVRQSDNLEINLKTLLDTKACPNCYLNGVDLRSQDLRGVDLRGANLFGARLEKSNLKGADLRGADLRNTNFRESNLKGAKLMGSKLVAANFKGANLKGADLKSAILDEEGERAALTSGAVNLSLRYAKMITDKEASIAKPQRNREVEVGVQAFKRRDYKTALAKLRRPAESGDSHAQVYLGYMFLNGNGVNKDLKKALSLFQKAALSGNDKGQGQLGYHYLEGVGVKKDRNQAIKWFKVSARQGNTVSQYNIGLSYQFGYGVPQNYKTAMTWFIKAAKKNNIASINKIGFLYQKGLGVAQNYKTARDWYRKSASQGDPNGQNNLGILYSQGLGVPLDERKALKWFRKSANQEYGLGQSNLGDLYRFNKTIGRNDVMAVSWYQKAAAKGIEQAENAMGWSYERGFGVKKDFKRAFYWYQKAASKGHIRSQYSLGYFYQYGLGVPKNSVTAFQWYQKIVQNKKIQALENIDKGTGTVSMAMTRLGELYSSGNGVAFDMKKAMKWYFKAADMGSKRAQYALGSVYSRGIGGMPKDGIKAYNWFIKVVASGTPPELSFFPVTNENKFAYGSIGNLYEFGNVGFTSDLKKAVEFYKKAAGKDEVVSLTALGRLYEDGKGVPEDDQRAIEYYQKAAELGYAEAQFRIAEKYNFGEGVKKNIREARRWYAIAARQGHKKAKLNMEKFLKSRMAGLREFMKPVIKPKLKRKEPRVIEVEQKTDEIEGFNKSPNSKFVRKIESSKPKLSFSDLENSSSEKRFALVVGNSNYKVRALDNPVRDARLIARTLRKTGFKTYVIENATRNGFLRALSEFRDKLAQAGKGVTALFYYSGHGVQYAGKNFLIPTDLKNTNLKRLDYEIETISTDRVLAAMDHAERGVKIVLLDACRDSPFKSSTKSGSKGLGLAKIEAPTGTIIGYATKAGEVATDGDDINSPYVQGLVRFMNTPGLTVESVLKKTRVWVMELTNGAQTPVEENSLTGDFYFRQVSP